MNTKQSAFFTLMKVQLFLLLALLFIPDNVHAAGHIFVSPGGTGAEPCPQAEPCSVNEGLDIASDGERVLKNKSLSDENRKL